MPKNTKKKNKLTSFIASVARKKRAKQNPEESGPLLPEMGVVTDVAAAAAAFTASVVADRIVTSLVAKKFAWAHHMSPLVRAGMFGLMWLIGSKIKRAHRYRDSLLIGAGVAVVHSIIQTWMPGLSFLVGPPQLGNVAVPRQLAGEDFYERETDEQIEFLEGDDDASLYRGSLARNN